MQKRLNIEYPAYVYRKNRVFVANCVLYNLIAIGISEIDAIENLQKILQKTLSEFNITVKPVYEKSITATF